jgi:dihydrodipicolinate synthase/N-acetylneuraminate lyase
MTSLEKASSSSTEGKRATPPRGLICPLITPLTPDRRLDRSSLESLLRHVHRHVDGILVGDLRWGEALDLDLDTRTGLATAVLEIVAGSLPVMVCITGPTLRHTRTLAAELRRTVDRLAYGGDLFTVDYPLVYHSNRDLPKTLAEPDARRGFPLVLGNDPDRVRSVRGPIRHGNIRTAVLKKIVTEIPVCAMIYLGSRKRNRGYQGAVRRRPGFFFYDGDESVFLKSPGSGGLVAGGSNLLPGPWCQVTRSSLNRYDTERQFHSHQQGIWASGVMLNELHRICRPAPAARMKRVLCRTGLIAAHRTAAPDSAVGPEWEAELEKFLSRFDLT